MISATILILAFLSAFVLYEFVGGGCVYGTFRESLIGWAANAIMMAAILGVTFWNTDALNF